MKIPLSAKMSMGACVGLYLTGYNLISSEEQPDLAGALFVALIVLLADRMRFNMQFDRVWMFAIALAVYYVISQLAMFCAWVPFWRGAESVVEWLCQLRLVVKVYGTFPRTVAFARRHSVAICKLLLMFFVSYGQLVEAPDRTEGEGIHINALNALLDPEKLYRLHCRIPPSYGPIRVPPSYDPIRVPPRYGPTRVPPRYGPIRGPPYIPGTPHIPYYTGMPWQ